MSDGPGSRRFNAAPSEVTHLFDPFTAESPEQLISSLSSPVATNLIFRGQSCFDWTLQSNLERAIEGKHMVSSEFRQIENTLIGEFKRHAKAVLNAWPNDQDVLGWLALMQHYRAPTRLLDWTESPFVALFFAIRDLDTTCDAALWILDPKKCLALHTNFAVGSGWDHVGLSELDPLSLPTNSQGLPRVNSFDEEQNYRFRCVLATRSRWPLPLLPDWQDSRMTVQQSVFTVVGSDIDSTGQLVDHELFEAQVLEDFPAGFGGLDTEFHPLRGNPFLTKVKIPGAWKEDLLVSLYLMGISNMSLFPGPDGLGQYASHRITMAIPLRDWLGGRSPNP